MTLSCLHTHTVFCDGKADMETMCAAAAAKGFRSIGFSSHAPIARQTGLTSAWHLKEERLGEYVEAALGARKRWAGKLEVYLGLEVDYIEGLRGPADRDIQELPLDYIIGAVHYVPSPRGGEPFTVDGPPEEFGPGLREFGRDGLALCEAYYRACRLMVEAGGFDILAHLDLIKKNNGQFCFFTPGDPAYRRLLAETAAVITAASSAAAPSAAASGESARAGGNAESARRRLVVEVNTGGMIRGRTAEPYPSAEPLGLLRRGAVPLTINADAHSPEHLGGFYGEAAAAMKNAGYRSALIFEGRRDGEAVWREEDITE
ncbi:MAG: histidinol-phosphatase [Treponema sp.]|jgi:histidinol-phosphatase (PHP family)|nr:histidinol-phosphatase [Treponema sp.]